MKKIVSIFILLNSFLILGQVPDNNSLWKLSWEDDFDSLDTERWLKVDWAQHGEPQLYLASNVTVSNGNLVITLNNNETYCPPNPATVWGACWPCDNQWYHYTSGWVETTQAYNTQFGYIEARIKLPHEYGFWPAFWTFVGSGVDGCNAAEIDIFEMLGRDSPKKMTTNIHLTYPDGNIYFQKHRPSNYNYKKKWHTYGVEWSPEQIIWYVDGVPIRFFSNHGIIDPVRIIFNLAIEPNHLPKSSTSFPSEMLIDYIRVYQLTDESKYEFLEGKQVYLDSIGILLNTLFR